MRGSVRTLLLALVLASTVLAGCLGAGDDKRPDLPELPDIGTLTERPGPGGQQIPECTLRSGDIAWPAMPGVPVTDVPVEVTLKTDAYGVTHIYADDAYSLFYANGYIQARDRLFQLDVFRLVGQGESARYLGAGQLASDFEVHRDLYTADEVEAQWQAAPEEGKQILQAYADGVNRFMSEAIARDALPAEFAAVGRVPPPWMPQDSVAVINYLIGFFGVAGGNELANLRTLGQLQATLGEERAWAAFGDWVWLRTDDTYTTISINDRPINGCEDPLPDADAATRMGQLSGLAAATDARSFGVPGEGEVGIAGLSGLIPFPQTYDAQPGAGLMEGFKWGSNALLVDGSHTATGVPIMWGAPQMGYFKPPVPYQVGLHGAGFDAVGVGVAGAPAIVIGRNAEIAWTATSGIEDQVDLVQVDLDGPRSYMWDGQSKAMDCWIVEHQTFPAPADLAALADGAPPGPPMVFEQEVCRAEGWPVVAINEEAGVAWLRTWTTRNEELMGAMMWLQVSRAQSIDEFREMVDRFPFTFNFHVASKDGVAFIHTGDIPLRVQSLDPRLPTPGGSEFAWRGEAYTGDMDVWGTDPVRGYYANWNNAPAWGWRAGDQPHLWGPVQRVQQIEFWMQQRLAATGNAVSWQDVADVNWLAATHDSLALPVLPHLVEAAAADPETAEMAQALAAWMVAGAPWRDADGDGRYDDPAHAIWDFMLQDMVERIQGDELGELNEVFGLDPKLSGDPHAGDHGTLNNKIAVVVSALKGNTEHDWCDDITTSGIQETCRQQLQAGLRAAKVALSEEYGGDISGWLQPIHTSQFTAVGGANPDERPMVNKGSWVQVVSMAESERSGSVLPPSNTGLLTPAELALLIAAGMEPARLTVELDLYWSGQFKPFPLTSSEVDGVAVSEETLVVLPPVGLPLPDAAPTVLTV